MVNRYNKSEAISLMNEFGRGQRPFLFLIDFEMKKIIIEPIESGPSELSIQIRHTEGYNETNNDSEIGFEALPIEESVYRSKFLKAQKELAYGNSFLLNLTAPTVLETKHVLADFYDQSTASYKVMLKEEFVSFSPECFVKIKNGKIFSYPMKGTSSVLEDPLGEQLLANEKENAEHATIVDLIRNDLSMVAKHVKVERFKYLDLIETDRGDLYQMSSEISGVLPENYFESIGTCLFKLLPAGSISGAPKKKTIEIIQDIEQEERGYYTGIAGKFDGKNLDSTVLIRFIEKKNNHLRFRSGGGITFMSDCQSEYEELIKKVYVPIGRNHTNIERKSLQYRKAQPSV